MSCPGVCVPLSCVVPENENEIVVIRPVETSSCIGGLHNAYEEGFPTELENYISRKEFEESIALLNDTIQMYWPCFICSSYGWACCPCTLGLSCCFPGLCVREAERELIFTIDRLNRQFHESHIYLQWQFKKSKCTSWIQVRMIPPDSRRLLH